MTDTESQPAKSPDDRQAHRKRHRLRALHQHNGEASADLRGLAPDQLPPASSSNAARQVRSRLNITFPVSWQDGDSKKQTEEEDSRSDS